MSIIGTIQNGKVEAKVELKVLPELELQEDKIRSLVKIDSFTFQILIRRDHTLYQQLGLDW